MKGINYSRLNTLLKFLPLNGQSNNHLSLSILVPRHIGRMANTQSQVVQGIHFRLKLDELIQQHEMPLKLSNVDKRLGLLTPNIEGHWECELGGGATHGGWLGDGIRHCRLAVYVERSEERRVGKECQ